MAGIHIFVAFVLVAITYCHCLPVKVEESDAEKSVVKVIGIGENIVTPVKVEVVHKVVKRSPNGGIIGTGNCPDKHFRAGGFCLPCKGSNHPDCGGAQDYSDDYNDV